MSTREEDIEQIEIDIKDAKKGIELREALKRLEQNKDFKKVILQGYFVDEASRIVLLKGDPSMMGEKDQAQAEKIIIGIGALRQYFGKLYHVAAMLEREIEENEKTREELLNEDLADTGTLQ